MINRYAIIHSGSIPIPKWTAFMLLLITITICYGNTLHSSWHFDDFPNIIYNSPLHINELTLKSITSTFYANPAGSSHLYRPLACLSFALNWYLGADNVFGYHIVNITIHFITACFLFLAIFILSQTPNLKPETQNNAYSIALLASTLWAVNPLQTQAVTYIVQRMASMAAMFYVMGIYLYLKGRLSTVPIYKKFYYAGMIAVYIFAVLSKENAILMPFAVMLIEIVFFTEYRFSTIQQILKFKIKPIVLVMVFSVMAIGCLMLVSNLSFLAKIYSGRPFSIFERLLTEPRIILIYMSQLFIPMASHISTQHDIIVSKSFFYPWTTMPAIIINMALIGAAMMWIRKRPLFSFAVLFFFLNHLVESTFLPLELIFEHRNYLPSLFLFIPVSALSINYLTYYKNNNFFVFLTLSSSIILFLGYLCVTTHLRNGYWATEKKLWEDVLLKCPELARPYQKLAEYYNNNDSLDKALRLYEKALLLRDQKPMESENLCLNNMGNIYLRKNEYTRAIALYKKAMALNPFNERTLYNLAFAYVITGDWEKAEEISDQLIILSTNQSKYLNLKGFVLAKQGKFAKALHFFKEALALDPNDKNILINSGCGYMMTGDYDHAKAILVKAHDIYPKDIIIFLCLIDINIQLKEQSHVDGYAQSLFKTYTIDEIRKAMDDISNQNIYFTINTDSLNFLIFKSLQEWSIRFAVNAIKE